MIELCPELYKCKGCNEVYEVCNEDGFKEPVIFSVCADCWDNFQRKDSEEQFEEAMNG